MNTAYRKNLIKNLETIRGSRVICYLTGDRQGLETKIGTDVLPLFYEILSDIGRVPRLDLFLYSQGGITMAGWGLVNLLREFCDELCVLVPFKAYSTGTLIALGANEIVMSRLGQLSPIDPSVQSPYNPQLKDSFLPVSVEDVVGFLDLARKEAKLDDEDSLRGVFEKLANDVRPMALGSVYRAREQIGMLAHRLLDMHMKDLDDVKKDAIVSVFTKDRFSHDYLISRREARDEIGLKVLDPVPDELERAMRSLYNAYANEMELNIPFMPEVVLGKDTEKVVSLERACIESTTATYCFISEKYIRRVQIQQPGLTIPTDGFQEKLLREGWQKETLP